MEKKAEKNNQIVSRNNLELIPFREQGPVGLRKWMEWYLDDWVTTSEATRKIQQRDLFLFLNFMLRVEETDLVSRWTPRLSEEYRAFLINTVGDDGTRYWGDRSCNRILANLKTFAKWLHEARPFPLGSPMAKIQAIPIPNPLVIERALTDSERRRVLDAADLLLQIGGRSKSRRRYAKKDVRPVRKGYRPYRNRAIIYTLLETGMRRNAVRALNLTDIDFQQKSITVMEKGRVTHTYQISSDGLGAIADYMTKERSKDVGWGVPALFLTAVTNVKGNGRMSARMINYIWDEVCKTADVQEKTPHSARHAMGRWIMERTKNIEAVQRQLGHRNAAYSMLYSRITNDELNAVLDDRNQGGGK